MFLRQADQLAVAVGSPIPTQEHEHHGRAAVLSQRPRATGLVEKREIWSRHGPDSSSSRRDDAIGLRSAPAANDRPADGQAIVDRRRHDHPIPTLACMPSEPRTAPQLRKHSRSLPTGPRRNEGEPWFPGNANKHPERRIGLRSRSQP